MEQEQNVVQEQRFNAREKVNRMCSGTGFQYTEEEMDDLIWG
jgi:hypothetical protein